MDLVKLGKWLMIIGFIMFLPLLAATSLVTSQMELSYQTASFISTLVGYLMGIGLGLLAIGAILYDVFKKRLKKKE